MPINPQGCAGCNEFQEWSRRRFLDRSAATAAFFATPAWLPRITLAKDENTSRDTMIVVFLRGGIDGLTAVAPYGDPNLYVGRPNIAVQPPGGGANSAVDLDGFFGFAPAMAPLLPAYQAGDLAIIHATGSPDPTRSHFDANSYMEYGIPLQPLDTFTGWLARHLELTPPKGAGLLRGLSVSYVMPKTLAGAPATLPIPEPNEFAFPGRPETEADRRAVLDATYATQVQPVGGAAQSTMATVDLLTAIDFDNYVPSGGAVYPQTNLGQSMRALAAIIKAEIGLEAGFTEIGGWDTHNEQGSFNGVMAALMNDLSLSLAAFHTDMQNHMNSLTLACMSEFGRRADENVSQGTDHGHGNCMLVMGGNIAGGQVIADWTDGQLLHEDLLYDGDSVPVMTDFRDVLGEILVNRLDTADLSAVFPNYTPTFPGVTV